MESVNICITESQAVKKYSFPENFLTIFNKYVPNYNKRWYNYCKCHNRLQNTHIEEVDLVANITYASILVQITLAVISDLRCYKVKNTMTFGFALLGILYSIYIGNSAMVISSMLGIVVPIVLLMPLYLLRTLGAGDIKLFCSIGAWLGFGSIILIIINSFLAGGIIAFTLMLTSRSLRSRWMHLVRYIKNCILIMDISPYDSFEDKCEGKMHFTLAIASGILLFLLM